jgi:hypothetical protein
VVTIYRTKTLIVRTHVRLNSQRNYRQCSLCARGSTYIRTLPLCTQREGSSQSNQLACSPPTHHRVPLYPAHPLSCPLSAPSWAQSPINSAESSSPVCRYMTHSAFDRRLPLKALFPLFMGKGCTFYNGVRRQCPSIFTCSSYMDFLTLSSLYQKGIPGRELGVPIGARQVVSVRTWALLTRNRPCVSE